MTNAIASAKEVKITATVIRADGTREELGVISSWRRQDDPPTKKDK
jgi:hypothetical protein